MPESENGTPEERAQKRVKEYTDVMWHVATYIIVNAFLWGLDLIGGGGADWAYWVTIGWGIGLAFHVASYFLDENGLQNRKYQRFLEEERAREPGMDADD